jgi:hypothetical protein
MVVVPEWVLVRLIRTLAAMVGHWRQFWKSCKWIVLVLILLVLWLRRRWIRLVAAISAVSVLVLRLVVWILDKRAVWRFWIVLLLAHWPTLNGLRLVVVIDCLPVAVWRIA